MRSLQIGIGVVVALTLATSLRADDWPQWMGPGRDNVWREQGVVDKLPAEGPKVLWRIKVGRGYAGPVVAGDLVFVTDFVTDAELKEGNFERNKFKGVERVLCLDAKTGGLKWKHEYPCVYAVAYPNGPRCTPNVEAGKLYTLGAEGNLICFEAQTGKIVWQRDLKADYKVQAPLWGFAAHPLIDGDRLICLVGGADSIVVAFDKTTGKELWKALSAEQPGYSPPTLIEAAGVKQLLIWHPEVINGLEPATGKLLWSVPQETVNGTSIMSPRKLGDFVFIGAWQRKAALLQLDSAKPGAKVVWKGNRDSAVYPVNNTPFLEDQHIYGVDTDGELRCVRMKDGERLWETYQAAVGKKAQSGTAHLIKHQDRFFIVAETGDLIVAKLSPKGYDEISRWHMLEPTSVAFGRKVAWSHPAFANQCIFARNDKEMICASLAK